MIHAFSMQKEEKVLETSKHLFYLGSHVYVNNGNHTRRPRLSQDRRCLVNVMLPAATNIGIKHFTLGLLHWN